MLQRKTVDEKYFELTSQQREDLKLFGRLRKWTPRLLALQRGIHPSSANRRLRKLIEAGALERLRGQPRADGGRDTDIYYPTSLGARLITRVLGLSTTYVEVPDVSNPIDNVHDLSVAEFAVCTQILSDARVFAKKTFTLLTGETVNLIPDLAVFDEVSRREVYIEVEQTIKPQHYQQKFAMYAQISADYLARDQPVPILIVVYPSTEIEQLLHDEHLDAADEAVRKFPGLWALMGSISLDFMRRIGVNKLAMPVLDTPPDQQRYGLLNGLRYWFDGAIWWLWWS